MTKSGMRCARLRQPLNQKLPFGVVPSLPWGASDVIIEGVPRSNVSLKRFSSHDRDASLPLPQVRWRHCGDLLTGGQ